MNERELFDMLTDIDEAYIEEAYTYKPKKRRVWARVAAIAACVVILVVAGYGLYQYSQPQTAVEYPKTVEYREEDCGFIAGCYTSPGAPLTFAQVADAADVIVWADVTDVNLVEGGTDWQYSYATIKVREVLKGDVAVGASYIVKDSDIVGGKDVYLSCGRFEPGPLMEKRNRVVLFLSGNTKAAGSFDEPFEISTATSGKFYLDADGLYHNAVTYVRYVGDHSRYFESDLADLEPKTLEQIKQLIHEKGMLYARADARVALLDDSELPDKVYGIPGLMNASEVVVSADVSAVKIVPIEGKQESLSVATVTVRECLKGGFEQGDTLTVVDNGVVYGDGTSFATYCGGPLMREGNRVILFLVDSNVSENTYEITTGVSGKFYINRYGNYVNSVMFAADYSVTDETWRKRMRINFSSVGTVEKLKQTVRPLLS